MKRIICALTVIILMMSLFTVTPLAVAGEVVKAGAFTFKELADGTYSLVDYNSNNLMTEVEIPAEYNGKAVTEIGEYAMTYEYNVSDSNFIHEDNEESESFFHIKSIKLPNTIRKIGEGAFKNLSIEKITLSENLVTIGKNVFVDCNNLKEIILPAKLKDIGYGLIGIQQKTKVKIDPANPYYTIKNKSLLSKNKKTLVQCFDKISEKYKVPATVRNIGADAFTYCRIRKFVLPKKLKRIGDRAFSNAIALIFKKIPNGIKYIGKNAFDQQDLPISRIPGSVKKIDERAFERGIAVEELIIEDGVKSIGKYAFRDCYIKFIRIPKKTKIGYQAFFNCGIEENYLVDLTIKGYKNSPAHKYAKRNNIKFLALTSLKNAKIYGLQKNVSYTGKKAKQELNVYSKGKLLKKGKDYRLKYKNNVKRGKATVEIIGIGHYDGIRKLKFKIK